MFRRGTRQQGNPTAAESREMVRAGMDQLRNGDREQARAWFERARRSEDPETLLRLGTAYQQMHDLLDAEQCLSKAAAAGNQEALNNLNNLGGMLEGQGRLTEARRVYHQAVTSGEFGALHNLGNLAAAEGDDEEAIRYWRQAAASGIPHSMVFLGRHLVSKRHQAEARLWYEQAADQTANDPNSDHLRAALDQFRRDLAALPGRAPDDPIAAAHDLREVGMAWHLDSLRTRDPRAQAQAVRALLAAADVLPGGHALMPAMRSDLSDVVLNVALDDEDRRKFDVAVKEMGAALRATPPGTLDHALRLARLARILMSRFETCYGDMAELDEVEGLFRDALAGMPPHDTRRAMLESRLARLAEVRRDFQEHGWPRDGVHTRHGEGRISGARHPSGGLRWIVGPHADVAGYGRQCLASYRKRATQGS